MSVAIALTLPDGVLLLADGRQIRTDAGSTVLSDKVDKIVPLRPRVFAVPYGLVPVTEVVLAHLRAVVADTLDPRTLYEEARQATVRAWRDLAGRLEGEDWKNDARFKAGVLVGGLLAGHQFYFATLGGTSVNEDGGVLEIDQVERLSVVGDHGGTEKALAASYSAALYGLNWSAGMGPHNLVTRRIVAVAAQAIGDLGRRRPTVGGTIRYVLVRKRFPVVSGSLGVC